MFYEYIYLDTVERNPFFAPLPTGQDRPLVEVLAYHPRHVPIAGHWGQLLVHSSVFSCMCIKYINAIDCITLNITIV
jgi:hypothetical protein